MEAKPVRFVVSNSGPDTYDVVVLGPHAVATDLKWIEAEALAKALNEEHSRHDDHK